MRRSAYTTAAWLALGGVYAPLAVLRRLTHGVPANIGARLGRWEPLPARGPRIWLHAVSVGDASAASPLDDGLRER